MSIVDLETMTPKTPFEGGKVRFIHTGNMTFAYWHLEKGANLPSHAHPHEQVANMISGELELKIGEETVILTPGKAAIIAPNVPHSARAISACDVLDVFHPVRDDLKD